MKYILFFILINTSCNSFNDYSNSLLFHHDNIKCNATIIDDFISSQLNNFINSNDSVFSNKNDYFIHIYDYKTIDDQYELYMIIENKKRVFLKRKNIYNSCSIVNDYLVIFTLNYQKNKLIQESDCDLFPYLFGKDSKKIGPIYLRNEEPPYYLFIYTNNKWELIDKGNFENTYL